MEKHWFRRLAEVPDIGYQSILPVDRSRLPGHNTVPEVEHHQFDGRSEVWVMWPTGEGTTSTSPAASWKTQPKAGEAPAEMALRQLCEQLELPGMLGDYHYAIQDCIEHLPKSARQLLWIWETLERLCWLNIRLIERYPETIINEYGEEKSYLRVMAFHHLIKLYEKEGYLEEALRVAEIAAKYQQHCDVERLRQRIALIETEEDAF